MTGVAGRVLRVNNDQESNSQPASPHQDAAAAEPEVRLASETNREVPVARAGEFETLRVGGISVWPPVVLAPMAGVTNYAFRSLCREYGAGLYVSEMITARAFLVGNRLTQLLASSHPDERPRSVQIYGSDPVDLGEIVSVLTAQGVDHIDLNLGCPVPKVTRNGGGSAIPAKPRLVARLVRAMVSHAGDVPITVKMRMGLDEDLLTFHEAARVAQEEGVSAVGLHARTSAQLYSGQARWDSIAELVSLLDVPVLGNGDIWECWDALRMMRETGCAGVIVGRGCLGRPWLFRELSQVFDGIEPDNPPRMGEIFTIMRDHLERLVQLFGEPMAIRQFRKWTSWYTKGFNGSTKARAALQRIGSRGDMERGFELLNPDEAFPERALRQARAKGSKTQKVRLPEGFLDDPLDDTPPKGPHTLAEIEAWEKALGGG
ncbi:MAG: nifR3 family TIM-barrel protein [Planctomycetota bacterium]